MSATFRVQTKIIDFPTLEMIEGTVKLRSDERIQGVFERVYEGIY